MAREDISIRTRDGDCRAFVFTPSKGSGPWPAVIFFMDGLAIRPALMDFGQRMADGGYVVLLPDLFYRAGPYEPIVPKEAFASGDVRKVLGPLLSSTDSKRAGADDTEAFLAYIDTRKDVAGKKVGTTGYCMGGAISLTAAATYPDRIAAAASFHGGGLASDSPLSVHLLAPKMKGRIYVGGAVDDASYPPEMNDKLDKALSDAGVDHRCEYYEGALHGWTMPDTPVYNEAAAERHWTALFALYAATLH